MMKVGGNRDWELSIPAAVLRTGEEGYHLRFERDDEKFFIFLGCEEIKQLCRILAELEPNH